eukprot:TRINITY_DN48631_c0_g1_i1.p1 TRINITY_DN48631_c0_g1~~TRINITY_DN48631_c0_g1_i1.p1  ORF type:complete len:346 (+),score=23.95 TRINITY_DN48631_c0_g1_i1:59-1039(+)
MDSPMTGSSGSEGYEMREPTSGVLTTPSSNGAPIFAAGLGSWHERLCELAQAPQANLILSELRDIYTLSAVSRRLAFAIRTSAASPSKLLPQSNDPKMAWLLFGSAEERCLGDRLQLARAAYQQYWERREDPCTRVDSLELYRDDNVWDYICKETYAAPADLHVWLLWQDGAWERMTWKDGQVCGDIGTPPPKFLIPLEHQRRLIDRFVNGISVRLYFDLLGRSPCALRAAVMLTGEEYGAHVLAASICPPWFYDKSLSRYVRPSNDLKIKDSDRLYSLEALTSGLEWENIFVIDRQSVKVSYKGQEMCVSTDQRHIPSKAPSRSW